MIRTLVRRWQRVTGIHSETVWLLLLLTGMLAPNPRIFAQTTDADGDGMADNYELFFGLNPTSGVDAVLDPDRDGNSNFGESVPWSDPFTMDTDRDGWIDGASDTNPLSRAVMLWGTPKFTSGTNYDYTGPSWWIGGERTGGQWLTNAWYCPATGSIVGTELRIPINRAQLTNSLVMGMTYFDHPGGQLHVDLIQSNGLTTAMDLFGNLIAGSSAIVSRTYVVPVTNSTQTAKIQLRHAWGAVTIYDTTLYIDRDLDGLDDAQELQAGTDPLYTNGIQAYLPGRIEAENYGPGGDGRGYHDLDGVNSGGAYRPGDGVDIELTTDLGGGYNVGWTRQGEWLAYTVRTTNEGFYALRVRVAQTESNSLCHIEVDGRDISGQIKIPNTGGVQVWQTVPAGAVYLAKGLHVIRLKFDAGSANGGNGNINYIDMATLGLATTVLQKGVSPSAGFTGCRDSTFRQLDGASFAMQSLGRDEALDPRWKNTQGSGIIWFDLASVPTNAVILRSSLKLWFEPNEFDQGAGRLMVYPLHDPNNTGMWLENTNAVEADYGADIVAGCSRYKRPGIIWSSTSDGRYDSVISTSEVRTATRTVRQNQWLSVDVTRDIASYVTNASQYLGWFYNSEFDDTIRGQLYSGDAATASKRPVLEIVYGLAPSSGPASNQAPSVIAGPNQTITLPSGASLAGTATDDGLPSNKLTVAWSKVSGTGTVTFANATSLVTTASFSTNGSYVLRLTASDTALIRTSTVTITVNPAAVNQAPVVSAGSNQTITLPSIANLAGTATDDGLPSNKLTVVWSKLVGAGTVTFGNATSLVTTASFSTSGSYALQLVASDTVLTRTGTVTITVNGAPTNQAPVVSAGSNQTITLPSTANLAGTATDDGLPSNKLTVTWSKMSGTGTVTFANATSLVTSASFSTNGSYVLRLIASDTVLARTGTVTVTVNPAPPVNQAPVVSAGSNQTVFMPGSANLSATVTDDGLPSNRVTVTWSKGSGPGTVTFGNSTSLVTTASFSTAGTYALRLTASDGLRQSTGTVSIAVSNMALSTTGLLAKWSFEQATWTGAVGEVRDSSIYSNHGRAFSGAIPVSNGVAGKAAWFDGTNDYIEVPSTTNLQVNGSMALMFWIKPMNIGAQRLNPLDKSYGGEFALTIETNGRLSYFHGTAQSTSNYWTYTALPSGKVVNTLWQHIAIVRDAASTNVRCYYNGILVSQAVYSVAAKLAPIKTTNAIRLGRGYTAQSILGNMDEVCIYSRALSASEVYGAYLATRPPNQAPYVNAGPDKSVTLPAAVSLAGVAADDGLPSNRLVVTWSKVSGTGTVTFANATSLVTTATMSTSGVYVLRLVASDGTLASTDAVQVTVANAPTNVAPTITSFTVTSASNFHNEGSVLMQASAIDSNGNAVSFQYTVQGTVVSAWSTNTSATWQPGPTNTGLRTFAVYARDPFGLTNSIVRTNFIFRTPPRP